jgi:hypothetical protein
LRLEVLELMVKGLLSGFRVQGSRFNVRKLGITGGEEVLAGAEIMSMLKTWSRVQGLGCRVFGLGRTAQGFWRKTLPFGGHVSTIQPYDILSLLSVK